MYVVAQLLLQPPVLAVVRRQWRTLFEGLTISEDDVAKVIRAEVIKRDVLDGVDWVGRVRGDCCAAGARFRLRAGG